MRFLPGVGAAVVLLLVPVFSTAAQEVEALSGGSPASGYLWTFAVTNPAPSEPGVVSFWNVRIEIPTAQPVEKLRGPVSIAFRVTNLTRNLMELVWNDCRMSSFDGRPLRVYQSANLDFYYPDEPQENTAVAGGVTVEDAFVPIDNVLRIPYAGYTDDEGEWHEPWNRVISYFAFSKSDFLADSLESLNEQVAGKEFTMDFAFSSEGIKYIYQLRLKITGVTAQG